LAELVAGGGAGAGAAAGAAMGAAVFVIGPGGVSAGAVLSSDPKPPA
jgi:hypothetical protein